MVFAILAIFGLWAIASEVRTVRSELRGIGEAIRAYEEAVTEIREYIAKPAEEDLPVLRSIARAIHNLAPTVEKEPEVSSVLTLRTNVGLDAAITAIRKRDASQERRGAG